MKCPVDSFPLKIQQDHRINFYSCSQCHGIWVGRKQLCEAITKKNFEEFGKLFAEKNCNILQARSGISCPDCSATNLYTKNFNGIHIDICPQCNGIWLDHGELEMMLKRSQMKKIQSQKNGFEINSQPLKFGLDVLDAGGSVLDVGGALVELLGNLGDLIP